MCLYARAALALIITIKRKNFVVEAAEVSISVSVGGITVGVLEVVSVNVNYRTKTKFHLVMLIGGGGGSVYIICLSLIAHGNVRTPKVKPIIMRN